jgi:predicted Zn-dependent protease
MTGSYAAAAQTFGELVREHPDDARLRLSYGEALLAAGRYASACAEFERLKGAALGARDRGVPAARACALSGDDAAAIGWLQTIPKRFLPAELERDAAFSSLRDRDDFRALFRR